MGGVGKQLTFFTTENLLAILGFGLSKEFSKFPSFFESVNGDSFSSSFFWDFKAEAGWLSLCLSKSSSSVFEDSIKVTLTLFKM